MSPKVSIIVPYYNQGNFIRETVESIYNQDYENFEIIIVNDGSNCEYSVSILDEFEKHCKVISKSNGGLPSARNWGIAQAKGEYICCIDSDDVVEPNFLSVLVSNMLSDSNASISYSNGEFFDEKTGFWFLLNPTIKDIVRKNSIYCSALYKKSDWSAVGGYNEKLRHGWEDWDFWITLMSQGGTVIKSKQKLFKYRIRNTSMARGMSDDYKKFAAEQIYKRNKVNFDRFEVEELDIYNNRLPLYYKIKWHLSKLFDK